MNIIINSANNVDATAGFIEATRERLTERLATRFGARLTRIEVHVRDLDGTSHRGDGIEATIEARPAHGAPISVSARAREPEPAVNAALGNLVSRLDSLFGKADRHRQ